jgi:hypothetical protein
MCHFIKIFCCFTLNIGILTGKINPLPEKYIACLL